MIYYGVPIAREMGQDDKILQVEIRRCDTDALVGTTTIQAELDDVTTRTRVIEALSQWAIENNYGGDSLAAANSLLTLRTGTDWKGLTAI